MWSRLLNKPGVRYSNSYVELYFGKIKWERDSKRLELGFGLIKIARFLLFIQESNKRIACSFFGDSEKSKRFQKKNKEFKNKN